MSFRFRNLKLCTWDLGAELYAIHQNIGPWPHLGAEEVEILFSLYSGWIYTLIRLKDFIILEEEDTSY